MDLDRPELTWLALAAAREQRPDEPLKLAPDPLLLRTGIGPAELEQIDEAMPPKLQLIRTQMALVLRLLPKVRAAANEAVRTLT